MNDPHQVELLPDSGATVPPATDEILWDWSQEAIAAFFGAASAKADGKQQMLNIRAGLEAALSVDAPDIFEQQLEGMIEMLTTHPVLGGRALQLKSTREDGIVNLKIDRDLITYILTDKLPDATVARMAEGTTTEETGNDQATG